MAVCVLDRQGRPLMPCSEKRARLLLARGRARVHRVVPFVIRIVDRRQADGHLQSLRVKLDPGSKVTGIALVRELPVADDGNGDSAPGAVVLSLIELVHRGRSISEALTARRMFRRRRRGANLRFRAPRFHNRVRAPRWLPPSLEHRVKTTLTWVARLRRWAPVTALSCELVRFDPQALEQPEIAGVEYQQGTLFGYELREYLLEKWSRRCAYCDRENLPLQIEHIQARAKGGTDRASNLTLACATCNQAKGALPIERFLARQPARLTKILAQTKRPLKDATAVNATRWALLNALKHTGLTVDVGSGGRTKFNRSRLGIPKTHALDAVCVGSLALVKAWRRPTLTITCTGRGSYKRTRLDRYGFPRGYLMRGKSVHGFRTGDAVRAKVPTGKKTGEYFGRVAVRASGRFNIQTSATLVQGIGHRHCCLVQRADGYGYQFQTTDSLTRERAGSGRAAHAALSLPGQTAEVSRAA
ncbi:HNH endonuclease (plasmid) [Cupriavidus sp. USMAA2-4]|uniref:RNA-guided endonuclease IscB n=1 Tax=Cupriavidus sp. USMAA2-4 TaxID=876364 RepID=UPI0008A6BF7A|nr:RNA-guided endonuclease IscB [Cupriavidus sp. USMAA2-4]AOY97482.1 HNH endonuclease [Cupriavidus sp. USMAA2-4]